MKHIGLVQSAQPGDNNKQQRQYQVGGLVVALPPRRSDYGLQPLSHMQLFANTLNQHHSAVVCQVRLVERKAQCLQAFAHGLNRKKAKNNLVTETYLLPIFYSFKNAHVDNERLTRIAKSCANTFPTLVYYAITVL